MRRPRKSSRFVLFFLSFEKEAKSVVEQIRLLQKRRTKRGHSWGELKSRESTNFLFLTSVFSVSVAIVF